MNFIIQLFALLLFCSSFMHISLLIFDYSRYMEIYAYLPTWLVMMRYLFSWFQRIVGLTVAVGLLYRKNFARILGMALGVFTIATIYWKHPYGGMFEHISSLFQKNQQVHDAVLSSGITLSQLTVTVMIIHSLLDITFWVLYITFFRKEKVRAQFN